MKKVLLAVTLSILPVLLTTAPAFSKGKGVQELVGEHSSWTNQLKNSKSFANKTVLVEVLDQKKSTKVSDLLDTVQSVLAAAQRGIFVDPIVLAERQNVSYISVEVDGAVVRGVTLKSQPPAEQQGVASLVISFKGDTTLPNQVLANIKTQ